jgi:hypothetical protein
MRNRSPARHAFQRLVPHPAVGKGSELRNIPPIMPRGAPRMKMSKILKCMKIFLIFPVIDWGKFLIFFSLPKNAGQYKI